MINSYIIVLTYRVYVEYLQLRDICSLLCFSIVSTRTEMDEENERFAARAGSMKESRNVAAKHPGFKEAFF